MRFSLTVRNGSSRPHKSLFSHVPDPVSGRRRDVDSQSSPQLLQLHGEQQTSVGHLLHLLFDELRLCGLLEVLGLGDLVHEAHDLAWFVASGPTFPKKKKKYNSKLKDGPANCTLKCVQNHVNSHPSAPAGSLESSDESSSSDEPALDDSSSLSARQ